MAQQMNDEIKMTAAERRKEISMTKDGSHR
jgi:hypothetical protein